MDDGQAKPPSGARPGRSLGNSESKDAESKQSQLGPGVGWAVLSLLISGMAVWGFLGWLVDRWLDTRFALPLGVVLGMAGAIVLIVRRYASFEDSNRNSDDTGNSAG